MNESASKRPPADARLDKIAPLATVEGRRDKPAEIGLMEYVRDFLPADWRQTGRLQEIV